MKFVLSERCEVYANAIEITFPSVCLFDCLSVCLSDVIRMRRRFSPEGCYVEWGYEKIATFYQYLALSRKRYKMGAI